LKRTSHTWCHAGAGQIVLTPNPEWLLGMMNYEESA